MELTYSTTITGYTIYLNGTPWIVQDGYVPFPADTMAHSAELHIQNILDEQKVQENTQTEFEKIVSIVDPYPIKDVYDTKEQLIGALSAYKFEYIKVIPFDGYLQKYELSDRDLIKEARESLELGDVETVNWKYTLSGGVYVPVNDPVYFTDMLRAYRIATQKAFTVEAILLAEIKNLAEKETYVYDIKGRFDEIYKQLA